MHTQEAFQTVFYGSLVLAAVVLASFILWFQLRNRTGWDVGLFVVASAAIAIQIGGAYLLGSFEATIASVGAVPGVIVYLWFAGLWTTRRERAAIYRWGYRQGYHITSLDRTYDLSTGGRHLIEEYRIVARRVSDGQIRVGRVLTGRRSTSGQGFDVLWEGELKPHSPHPPKKAGFQ